MNVTILIYTHLYIIILNKLLKIFVKNHNINYNIYVFYKIGGYINGEIG